MTAEGVPYTTLTAKDLETEYAFRNLPSTYTGLFQADGASIDLKATIRTLIDWNRASAHTTLREEAPVIHIAWEDGAFQVRTPLGTSRAAKLVLAPGPFCDGVFGLLGFRVPELLPPHHHRETRMSKTYSIFGAGASGLYTAWRLLDGEPSSNAAGDRQLQPGDVLELYDWGNYDFSGDAQGLREPAGRICTWHYKDDPNNSYVELGGMRYARWDGNDAGDKPGHRLVTTVIARLGLDRYVVPFNESTDPLFYTRSRNYYLSEISSRSPAPYNASGFAAASPPDNLFGVLQNLSPSTESNSFTRAQWDRFYQHGRIEVDLPESSVFQRGDHLKDIGYWNLMYDQLGSEGYTYAADGNGYTSNVINWNSAVAFQSNNEFTPGTAYFTLTTGYSGMFAELHERTRALAEARGVDFRYISNTRLQAIYVRNGVIHYTLATRAAPYRPTETRTTQAAWLAMPRHSIDLVARGTRHAAMDGALDVLNHERVALYLESAVMQPSYKVGMFFQEPWWQKDGSPDNPATYPAKITGYEVTQRVIRTLAEEQGFPKELLPALANAAVLEMAFTSAHNLVAAVEQVAGERLTYRAGQQLTAAALRNTIGPTITDTPIRMVVYFGDNAVASKDGKVYGILASYDDERFASFWREMEIGPNREQHKPRYEDTQPLDGPRTVPPRMVKMLQRQLAELHYGPGSDYSSVPEPLEARYMNWSLPPFNAGYHAYAAHYDVADVQVNIRKPTQLIPGTDADIFIVGETYSNDQAWVEGAYCTAESVLNDFFGIKPIINDENYPFIAKPVPAGDPTRT